MKLSSLLTSAVVTGILTFANVPLQAFVPSQQNVAFADTVTKPDATKNVAVTLTAQQKIAKLTEVKGKKGSGDLMRSYFAGDLEPIGIQPGGAGMVVNFYNKANNLTVSYCSTFDVIVAVKQGKIAKFAPNEVK